MTQKRGRCKRRRRNGGHIQAAKLIDNQLVSESIFVSKENIKKVFLIFNFALDGPCLSLCNVITDKVANCEAVVCGNSLVLREATSTASEEGHDWLERVEELLYHTGEYLSIDLIKGLMESDRTLFKVASNFADSKLDFKPTISKVFTEKNCDNVPCIELLKLWDAVNRE